MTVQELINKLNTVEDKSISVGYMDHEYGEFHEFKEVTLTSIQDILVTGENGFWEYLNRNIIELEGW